MYTYLKLYRRLFSLIAMLKGLVCLMEIKEVAALASRLRENVSKVIIGKDDVINKVTLCLFCGGHILLEDIPGTGKTTMAKAFARSLSCDFARVQFTPDLLPSELTGINYYNQQAGEFTFKPGSIFTNILLGDEINRATPRTQSALLECMEEGQVSVDGKTYALDKPFLVIATQNPVEIQGTFPLPEAQLDRFFMRLSMGYPDAAAESQMLSGVAVTHPVDSVTPVATGEDILAAQEAVKKVKVSEAIRGYIVAIADATRRSDRVRLGLSPRGSIALMRASQAMAAVNGRGYVLPDDVKAVAHDVICHRMICKGFSASQSAAAPGEVLSVILGQLPVPTE